ncbi:thermonuclease family protein [Sinorhizobium meliloti]|nr:thermonuclease family protein [Sinorhizobium meliloti]RVG89283.1 thermonuclease family protein [Sinorhizobium meliloti]RVI33968.1 thermonuclease family protein [Sinorhizobium meliloti]RVI45076.1 thermonuclease family protein [Sinorhizobium meliloti]RVJ30155.1 thermonuclease family protein [Sinorhizobium meliloti]RVK03060.1 thermonuclease family protein [Sinorhizobium meliloti]
MDCSPSRPALALSPELAGSTITGRASVVDGDTIEIAGQRIRLNGVDAPESWQRCDDAAGKPYRCGRDAAFALDEFLAEARPTACEPVDRDRYGRVVAVCHRADGAEVGTWLVESGHAVDWARYSRGAYRQAQEAAKAVGRGIWQGAFIEPCQARRSGQQARVMLSEQLT